MPRARPPESATLPLFDDLPVPEPRERPPRPQDPGGPDLRSRGQRLHVPQTRPPSHGPDEVEVPAVVDAPAEVDAPAPVAAELDACRRCGLWRDATRGVPGEGPARASLMLVGEQPGDQEDRSGRPFVGPAGRLLDELLEQAGIARAQVFTTNAVKHFKWVPRGTRRIHKTPAQQEASACLHWLARERAAVRPRVIVALGATAARSLLGAGTTVEAARRAGPVRSGDAWVVVSFHPSALLRVPDRAVRASMTAALTEDLRTAAALAARAD